MGMGIWPPLGPPAPRGAMATLLPYLYLAEGGKLDGRARSCEDKLSISQPGGRSSQDDPWRWRVQPTAARADAPSPDLLPHRLRMVKRPWGMGLAPACRAGDVAFPFRGAPRRLGTSTDTDGNAADVGSVGCQQARTDAGAPPPPQSSFRAWVPHSIARGSTAEPARD